MISRPYGYKPYLLRCWAEPDTNSSTVIWRYSLQSLADGQRRGFATLTELVIALQGELMENLLSAESTAVNSNPSERHHDTKK